MNEETLKPYSWEERFACNYCIHRDPGTSVCFNTKSLYFNNIPSCLQLIQGCEEINYDGRLIDEACLKQMPIDSFLLKVLGVSSESGKTAQEMARG